MASEDDAHPQAEEELPAAPSDQKTDPAVARDVDECSDDDDDDDDDNSFIRHLNQISRLNLMTPEWIEELRKMHYEEIALHDRVYHALQNGEIETDSDDDDDGTAAAQRNKRLWAGVDLSGLNIVGGESRGMDPVAVYPVGLYPQEEEAADQKADDLSGLNTADG